jgi:type 1 glutamine amidotransferase
MNRIILTLLACVAFAGSAAAADARIKILLIGKDRDHAPETHEYMADCELLARCLRQTAGVDAVVSNGWPKEADALKDVRAIVFYTQKGGNVLFAEPNRRQAEQLLKDGVGLVAIHWGTGADAGPTGDLWLKALGGWFHNDSRFLVRNAKVKQAEPEHPICRGWEEYLLRDEYYVNLRFLREATPILKAQIDDREETIAWTYERPDSKKGRSFGFVCGHFHANFGEEPFRRTIVNAILWSAHRDVPKAGAPCALKPKDLELPPDPRKK